MSGSRRSYAANTFGAVVGCLLSAFLLLAVFDVWVATFAAVALNFAIGALALVASGRRRTAAEVAPPPPVAAAAGVRSTPHLVAACLSGLTALGAQVVWTRLLTLLFGATVYAFAIILAVFLAGLGIGSAIASYMLKRGRNPHAGLAWTQIALIPSLLLGGLPARAGSPYASPPAWTPVAALHAMHVIRAVMVIIPGAIFWGLSFPFALAAAAAGGGDTGHTSGRVYAANTVGAIAGALAVSFCSSPSTGRSGRSACSSSVAALSGAALLLWLRRAQSALQRPAVAVDAVAHRDAGGGCARGSAAPRDVRAVLDAWTLHLVDRGRRQVPLRQRGRRLHGRRAHRAQRLQQLPRLGPGGSDQQPERPAHRTPHRPPVGDVASEAGVGARGRPGRGHHGGGPDALSRGETDRDLRDRAARRRRGQ